MGPTKDAESKLEHATSKQGDAPFSTNALLPRLIQDLEFYTEAKKHLENWQSVLSQRNITNLMKKHFLSSFR